MHRDLKSSNIMFTDSSHEKIKIIDLGLSTTLKEEDP